MDSIVESGAKRKNENKLAPAITIIPNKVPNCFQGIPPMNIITRMTRKVMAAVEKFSGTINKQITTDTPIIHLNARRCAPASSRMLERIMAVVAINTPLAISEGWKPIPPTSSQRLALFTFVVNMAIPSKNTDNGMPAKGINLK